jgi:hypothetical protein
MRGWQHINCAAQLTCSQLLSLKELGQVCPFSLGCSRLGLNSLHCVLKHCNTLNTWSQHITKTEDAPCCCRRSLPTRTDGAASTSCDCSPPSTPHAQRTPPSDARPLRRPRPTDEHAIQYVQTNPRTNSSFKLKTTIQPFIPEPTILSKLGQATNLGDAEFSKSQKLGHLSIFSISSGSP